VSAIALNSEKHDRCSEWFKRYNLKLNTSKNAKCKLQKEANHTKQISYFKFKGYRWGQIYWFCVAYIIIIINKEDSGAETSHKYGKWWTCTPIYNDYICPLKLWSNKTDLHFWTEGKLTRYIFVDDVYNSLSATKRSFISSTILSLTLDCLFWEKITKSCFQMADNLVNCSDSKHSTITLSIATCLPYIL
jgi:hypothetical protein